MEKEEQYIGYLKYSGKSVEGGLLDVRKSAEALLGFDEVLRYFLLEEDPSLSEIEFEIPVRIREGSWEALIPETIEAWILTAGGGVALTTYMTTTAKKAANDGFLETGIAKDIKATFKNSIRAVQWVIKIASHVGSLTKKKFQNIKIEQIEQENFLKIPNAKDEYLTVPKKYFDLFSFSVGVITHRGEYDTNRKI